MFYFVRECNNADVYHLRAAFCQALLVDVRDKLLFEQDYAGNIKEKVPPRSSLHIPWSWLPAALCILQEVMHNTDISCQNVCWNQSRHYQANAGFVWSVSS
jgi:rhodanese-related sulfurtransferase